MAIVFMTKLALVLSVLSNAVDATDTKQSVNWQQAPSRADPLGIEEVDIDTVLLNCLEEKLNLETMSASEINMLEERNVMLEKENAMLKKLILGQGDWVKEVTEDEVVISLNDVPDEESETDSLVHKVEALLASADQDPEEYVVATMQNDKLDSVTDSLDINLEDDDQFEVQLDEYEITLEYEPELNRETETEQDASNLSTLLQTLESAWTTLSSPEAGDLAHEGDEWSFESKPEEEGDEEFVTTTSSQVLLSTDSEQFHSPDSSTAAEEASNARLIRGAIRALRGAQLANE
jgi:hypothetical protein